MGIEIATAEEIAAIKNLRLEQDMTKLMLHGQDGPRGTNALADTDSNRIIFRSVDGVELNKMWKEFNTTLKAWNKWRSPLVNLLTHSLDIESETVRTPEEQDMEEASEFGVPKGITSGDAYRFGYSLKFYDIAIRYTWRYLLKATSDEIRGLHLQAMDADGRKMFQQILRRVFNNGSTNTVINYETLNVYGFYNGDSMVPPRYQTNVHSSGHNHYLVSGGATVDAGDLNDMVTHLNHHGYTLTNGYRQILLVNPAQGDVIRGFKVSGGAKFDFIPGSNYGGGVYLQEGKIVGAPATNGLPAGLEVIGTWGPLVVIEDGNIPAGYMFAFATGGEKNLNNPIGLREDPQVKGLTLLAGSQHGYPLQDSYYLHGFGTGVRHRGAGVVMQVKASGSYEIPTAYA